MPEYYQDYTGAIIRARWMLEGEIGAGGFGQVYLATDLKTNTIVAVKTSPLKTNPNNSASAEGSLQHESAFYKYLGEQTGIATLHDIGTNDLYSIEFMVCDLLGASLWCLLGRCGHRFSLKTTLMLADQLISRVEMLHSKNIVHRDLKMENIVMGFGKEDGKTAYILDFGLSGYFRPQSDYKTAPGYYIAGTMETACIAWHLNRPQSPKDDLESLAYVLIYLFRGYLPWTTDGGSLIESYSSERTLKLKLSLPIEIICKDMPSEFARHLKYARSLKYEDTPNYGKLQDMYRRLMKRMGYQYDGVYDWDLKDRNIDEIKQPSGVIIPASAQDKPLEQEKPVPQSESLIPETPLAQNKPLAQSSPSPKDNPLKRKNLEDDKENVEQEDEPEEITQPAKKRKIILIKATDEKQPALRRRGRPPKAQPKQAITKNAQEAAMTTKKVAETNEVTNKKASPRKKPVARKKACE
ncbi:casein kinase I isoform delta [Trichoderma gamsii]|uniref:non-specific serine/threonine protein kinase n=1 Tax=Trichoderma gamsii TaxID=398673 RepID=A0A2P4ZYM8_9HYPO|nr:casein kinase I isoform delta [Trichoderma gamsii]PON29386.1 casein kinase I isoform delta [Trichoderma gamsii]